MSVGDDGRPLVRAPTRDALRVWLAEHHERPNAVWLAVWSRADPMALPWDEAEAELVCWGWAARPVQPDAGARLVARRDPARGWREREKRLAERERRMGRMEPPGEIAVAHARETGTWSLLDPVERGVVPPDLADALGDLRPRFDLWPRAVRHDVLEWLLVAPSPGTRARRIANVVDDVAANRPPAHLLR